jgi:hypothetical protein
MLISAPNSSSDRTGGNPKQYLNPSCSSRSGCLRSIAFESRFTRIISSAMTTAT